MENFGRDLADLAGEGYRGFQQKFSPLVVRRALLLDGDQPIHRKVPVGWANISKFFQIGGDCPCHFSCTERPSQSLFRIAIEV